MKCVRIKSSRQRMFGGYIARHDVLARERCVQDVPVRPKRGGQIKSPEHRKRPSPKILALPIGISGIFAMESWSRPILPFRKRPKINLGWNVDYKPRSRHSLGLAGSSDKTRMWECLPQPLNHCIPQRHGPYVRIRWISCCRRGRGAALHRTAIALASLNRLHPIEHHPWLLRITVPRKRGCKVGRRWPDVDSVGEAEMGRMKHREFPAKTS